MKNYSLILLITVLWMQSCTQKKDFDAAGNFEADETMIAAQQNGVLLKFDVTEGQHLDSGQTVGQIDVEAQRLQQDQNTAMIHSLQQKTTDADPQIAIAQKQLSAQQAQLTYLHAEKERINNLVNADAAPRKQLDDINEQIVQMNKQMAVVQQQITSYSESAALQNRAILSEAAPLEKSKAQIQYQISKGEIVNPISGTVLTRYAQKGEMATIGRPLYKIANVDTLNLKAYVTGNQLVQIKLGQHVTARIDDGNGGFKNYPGTISWIADKSEFTPKTIQTKSERVNLVYAIKVKIKNDGYLKIGMYGEVLFALTPASK